MTDFIHPETGELLATEEEWAAAVKAAEDKLGAFYREVIYPLRNGQAERFPAADRPARRRDRTDTQEKVERCPRCGTRIEEEAP